MFLGHLMAKIHHFDPIHLVLGKGGRGESHVQHGRDRVFRVQDAEVSWPREP